MLPGVSGGRRLRPECGVSSRSDSVSPSLAFVLVYGVVAFLAFLLERGDKRRAGDGSVRLLALGVNSRRLFTFATCGAFEEDEAGDERTELDFDVCTSI